MNAYVDIVANMQHHQAMIVQYEVLVINLDNVLERIASVLNWSMPSKWQFVNQAAKTHGEPVGRDSFETLSLTRFALLFHYNRRELLKSQRQSKCNLH
jgi:hypothetical protein